jgi:pyruvate dehydrogenase E1 component beta subunit
MRDPDPVIFMEPKKLYRSLKEDVPEEDYSIPLGQARVMVEGTDVTIIGWGAMIPVALKAHAIMQKENVSCEIIDLRTLSPLDTETIFASVAKTGRAVIVQEGPRTCGLAGEISTLINEKLGRDLRSPVKRVTGFDIIPPLLKAEDFNIPSEKRLVAAIRTVL